MEDLLEEVYFVIKSHAVGQHLASLEIAPLSEEEDLTIENLLAEMHGGGDIQISTIEQKLESKAYAKNIYLLYRDLKLATSSELIKLPIASEPYIALDEFFRFIVEVLCREGTRLGLIHGELIKSNNHTDPSTASPNRSINEETSLANRAFEQEAMNGFVKISADVKEWYGESYYIVGQNGPLFSSINGRSPIDPRDAEVHGQFHTTKLLGKLSGTQATQMAYVSPVYGRIPHPCSTPSEILGSSYVHPSQTELPSSKWVKYDGYSTFAPAIDDSGSIVGHKASGAVWFEKIGMRKLEMMDDEDVEEETQEGVQDGSKEPETGIVAATNKEERQPAGEESEKENEQQTTDQVDAQGVGGNMDIEVDDKSTGKIIERDSQALTSGEDIDLINVLEWKPGNFIDDDEFEAVQNNTESQLVSRLLLQLQVLQRERLANPLPHIGGVPTEEERRLAFKIQNILSRLLSDSNPRELGITSSPYIPVSMTNYPGVLPAPDPKQIQQQQNKMVGNLQRAPQRSYRANRR